MARGPTASKAGLESVVARSTYKEYGSLGRCPSLSLGALSLGVLASRRLDGRPVLLIPSSLLLIMWSLAAGLLYSV